MAKLEFTDGQICIMLLFRNGQNRIHRRPYGIYANYRDGQNGIYRRPH